VESRAQVADLAVHHVALSNVVHAFGIWGTGVCVTGYRSLGKSDNSIINALIAYAVDMQTIAGLQES
jgi:hypothetical protein